MTTARELTIHLARLLREEQGAMADFLLALAQFDRQKLWRELGHTSLFYYLHRELRLSKGAAQSRKTAAELIQKFPEVEAALRGGDLCLSTVNELARVLTPENRAEVLPRFFGLSRREAEAVAASLRPAEVLPTREVITAVRAAASTLRAAPAGVSAARGADGDGSRPVGVRLGEPDGAIARQADAGRSPPLPFHLAELNGAIARQADADGSSQVRLAEPTRATELPVPVAVPAPPPPRESVDPLDAERARVHLTVSRRFLEKLEAARDALGHACPGGSAAEILERGLDLVLAEHAKRRGLVEKPRKSRGVSRSDTIPAEVKREVWRRAGGRCEYRLESGERCGCRHRLETGWLDLRCHAERGLLRRAMNSTAQSHSRRQVQPWKTYDSSAWMSTQTALRSPSPNRSAANRQSLRRSPTTPRCC